MAKNRKSQSAAVRFGPVVKIMLVCGLICGAGLGYVNQNNSIHLLGEKLKEQENLSRKIDRERQLLIRKITELQSPTMLEARVKRMNLNLAPVAPDRIIHIVVPTAQPTVEREKPLYAEQSLHISSVR